MKYKTDLNWDSIKGMWDITQVVKDWKKKNTSAEIAVSKIKVILETITFSFPPPKAEDRQVYIADIGWGPEWFVQYGPDEVDRYGNALDQAEALAQWHRIHILGHKW